MAIKTYSEFLEEEKKKPKIKTYDEFAKENNLTYKIKPIVNTKKDVKTAQKQYNSQLKKEEITRNELKSTLTNAGVTLGKDAFFKPTPTTTTQKTVLNTFNNAIEEKRKTDKVTVPTTNILENDTQAARKNIGTYNEIKNTNDAYKNYENEYYKTPLLKYQLNMAKVNEKNNFGFFDKATTGLKSGLDSVIQGRQYKDENGNLVDLPTYNQLKSQKISETSGKLGKIYQDVTTSIGAMLPSVVAGLTTGGIGLGTQLGSLGTMFLSSSHNASNQALLQGKDKETAKIYGITSGAIEVLTEKMFGGIGKVFGKGQLDDVIKVKMTKKISNALMKTLAENGIMAVGEGVEELVSGVLDPVAQKLTGMSDEDLGKLYKDSDLLEQFLLGTLTSVVMQAPSFNSNYKLNQLNQLNLETLAKNENGQQNIFNGQQNGQINNAKNTKNTPKINNFNTSVNNYANKYQIDNSFVKIANKIIDEKGYSIVMEEYLTNEKGIPVNGLITTNKNGEVEIKINPQSNRAGEFLLAHEITHAIETKELKGLIMEHAKKSPEFNSALESLKQAYGTNDVSSEVIADISGQLLGNQEFIRSLSMEKPSLFKKIYDVIVSLLDSLTGNKIDSLFLKDLKNKWANAYRTITPEQSVNNLNNGNKYQLSENALQEGKIKEILPQPNSEQTSLDTSNIPHSNNSIKSDTSSTKYSMQENENNTQETDKSFVLNGKTFHFSDFKIKKEVNKKIKELNSIIFQNSSTVSDEQRTKYREIVQQLKELKLTLPEELEKVDKPDVTNLSNLTKDLDNLNLDNDDDVYALANRYITKINTGVDKITGSNLYDDIYDIDSFKEKYIDIDDYDGDFDENEVDEYNSHLEDKYINKIDEELKKEGISRRYDKKYDNYFYDTRELAEKGYNEMIDYFDKNNIKYEITKSTEAGYVPSVYIKNTDGDTIFRIGNHDNGYVDDFDMVYDDTYNNLFKDKDYANWKEKILPKVEEQLNVYKDEDIEENSLEVTDRKSNIEEELDNSSFNFDKDNKGRKLSKEQQEKYKYSKIRDKDRNLKTMYHGTKRADRVGTYFDPTKATSGPMAFFTDDKEIATNYSMDKTDTSLSREYDTEKDLFKVNGKTLDEYWNSLSYKEQQDINKKAKNVQLDEDFENIIYDDNHDNFGGQYEYYLKHGSKNNGIDALYKVFIEDGNLMYEDIHKFKDALKLAGINNVEYIDTYKVEPKVYEVYLNITNPFDTGNMPENIVKQFKEASKTATVGEQYSADMWDKSNITPENWIEKLESDIENNTTHAWTCIPDWVTNVLKSNGYDGIKDTGGKQGGTTHEVVIPFYSEQIKNIDNTNPTDNPDIRYSQNSKTWQEHLEKNYKSKGTRTYFKEIPKKTPKVEEKKVVVPISAQDVAKNPIFESQLNKEELEELEILKNMPFELDETEQKRYDYLTAKNENRIKYPELKSKITYDDIKGKYTKYKNLDDFNPDLLSMAKSFVNGYKNTEKRTKAAWLDVAKLIGSNIKSNNSEELTKYAMQSWFYSKPNIKGNMNRQGKSYVPFTIDEWVNSVYDGAGVGNITKEVKTDNENKGTELKDTSSEDKKIANLLDKRPLKESKGLKSEIKKLYQVIVDKGKYVYDLAKKTGNEELYAKYDQMGTARGTAEYSIGVAQVNNEGKEIGKSLVDIWQPITDSGKETDFSLYLLHKHNIDRYAQGKPVFGEDITSDISRDAVKEYEKNNPEFVEWSSDISSYNKNQLQNMVDAGLTSAETQELLNEMYDNYVRIYRDINGSTPITMKNGKLTVNNPIKKAKGGNQDILPLKDGMAQQTLEITSAIRRNQFGLELKKTLNDGEEITEYRDVISDNKDGTYSFIIFENGKPIKLNINEELYESIKPIEKQSIENTLLLRGTQKLLQFQRGLITDKNPFFLVRNFFKDLGDAVFNSKYSKSFLKNFSKAYYDITTDGEYSQLYKALGGYQQSYFDNDVGLKYPSQKKSAKFIHGIQSLNQAIEMAPRLAEFISSIEAGETLQSAMYNAAEITTNFKRGGETTKFINRNFSNFLNASVQGFDKQYRNFTGQNGAKGYINLLFKATIFGVLPSLLNHLLLEDDDDYQDLPSYIKDNYYLFKTSDNKFIRIPKGRVVGVFGNAVYRTLDYTSGNKDAYKGFISNSLSNVAPSNPIGNNVLSPFIQVATNKSWNGSDIVPQRLKSLHKAEQFDEKTDWLSKTVGELFNISPKKVNYLLDQYSGVFGDTLLPLSTPQAEQNPIFSAFTVNNIITNKYSGDFYDKKDELTANANSVKATDSDKLKYKYFNAMQSEMDKMYKEKREIQMSDMKDSEKRKQIKIIQSQINDMAKETVSNYNDVYSSKNYGRVSDMEYYLNSKNEWTKVNDDEKNSIVSLNMTDKDKDAYFKAKVEIGNLKNDKTMEASEKKKEICDIAISSSLNDKNLAFLYGKYYSSDNTLNTMLDAGVSIKEFIKFDSQDFETEYASSGKKVKNSMKNSVIKYANSLNLTTVQKAILIKTRYSSFNQYDNQISKYINKKNMTKFEKASLLKKIGIDSYDKYIISYINSKGGTVSEKAKELKDLGFFVYTSNGKTYIK